MGRGPTAEHLSGKLVDWLETAARSSVPVTAFLNPAGRDSAHLNRSSVTPGISTREANSSKAKRTYVVLTVGRERPSSLSTFFKIVGIIWTKRGSSVQDTM